MSVKIALRPLESEAAPLRWSGLPPPCEAIRCSGRRINRDHKDSDRDRTPHPQPAFSNEQIDWSAQMLGQFLRRRLADLQLAAQNLGGETARSEDPGEIGLGTATLLHEGLQPLLRRALNQDWIMLSLIPL